MDIVYGGGLKQDNAEMLASIDEIDGGLIALTMCLIIPFQLSEEEGLTIMP